MSQAAARYIVMKGAADEFLEKPAELKFAEAGIGSDILQPERFRTVQIDVIADICKFFSVLKLLLRFIAVRLQIIDILSSQSYEKACEQAVDRSIAE